MALLTEEKQFYNLPSILGTYVVIPPKDVPNNSESIHLNVFIWLKNIVTLAFTMILFYVLRGRIFYTPCMVNQKIIQLEPIFDV